MPETLKRQTVSMRTRVIIGGLIAANLIGGGINLREFNSAGKESPTASYPAMEPFNAFITATGSTSNTLRYAATCIANPLKGLNLGSGALFMLEYQVGTTRWCWWRYLLHQRL